MQPPGNAFERGNGDFVGDRNVGDASPAGAAFISLNFYGGSFFVNSLVTGIILWAGFTAARFITHDAFDGRPTGLTVLNVAHEFVTIVVMALIIGVWPA